MLLMHTNLCVLINNFNGNKDEKILEGDWLFSLVLRWVNSTLALTFSRHFDSIEGWTLFYFFYLLTFMLFFCVCIECMMIGRKLMGLEGFTDIFNDFFSARVHQCLRHVSIYLLSVFCMGPSLYYVSKRTGWVGSDNGNLCCRSVIILT